MTLIEVNPYEGIDWASVGYHKTEHHSHVRGEMSEPADVVDVYSGNGPGGNGNTLPAGEEYTVFPVSHFGTRSPTRWPWTDFSSIDGSFADRDPSALGVVSYPAIETRASGHHTIIIFSTIVEDDWDGNTRGSAYAALADQTETWEPEAYCYPAHPQGYLIRPDYKRYIRDFDDYTGDSGEIIGFEIFNNALTGDAVEAWDLLLSHYAPDLMIWGFGNDDPGQAYDVGGRVGRCWTTLLLDDVDFDPSDQANSRTAAAHAHRDGAMLIHQRDGWDPATEEPPTVPQVTSIDVDTDADTITISATDYDSLEWINRGITVGTDETIQLTDEMQNYIRCHLTNAAGETSTQPIGLAAPNTAIRSGRGA